MSGSRKLHAEETEEDQQEVYLRDGRKLVIGEHGGDQLVEVRSASGMVEVRIVLTERGPVLQMESVRLQLKAEEAVEIESANIQLKAREKIEVQADGEVEVQADGDVRVVGNKIFLN